MAWHVLNIWHENMLGFFIANFTSSFLGFLKTLNLRLVLGLLYLFIYFKFNLNNCYEFPDYDIQYVTLNFHETWDVWYLRKQTYKQDSTHIYMQITPMPNLSLLDLLQDLLYLSRHLIGVSIGINVVYRRVAVCVWGG